jgi:hypothetical protein
MESSAPAAKANGLATVINTIAAPSDAFETIRVAPTWGWACLIAIVLMLIGTYLQGPAARHAAVASMQQAFTTSSLLANITPEKKQQMIAQAGQPSVMSYVSPIITIFVVVLFNTLLMLIGNAVGRGQADFKRLWAGSMNIVIPTLALGAVILGIITTLRGPDSFTSLAQVIRATPSLAYLAPGASVGLGVFLAGISVFSLWGLFLNATMLRVTAKTTAGVAYTFAILVTVLGALTGAAFLTALHNMGFA